MDHIAAQQGTRGSHDLVGQLVVTLTSGALFDLLVTHVSCLQHSAVSEQELAEIRAIERVGSRRRRQWLNDKLLRDLAGPMTTQDMVRTASVVEAGIIHTHTHTHTGAHARRRRHRWQSPVSSARQTYAQGRRLV